MWMLGLGALLALGAVGLAIADVFWPLGVAIGLVVATLWGTHHLVWLWVLVNPLGIAGYIAIGLAWVFFRWTRHVEQAVREVRRKARKLSSIPEFDTWDGAAYFFYWPVDVIAYVLSDVLQDIWRWVSATVAESFNAYARWRFARETPTKRFYDN